MNPNAAFFLGFPAFAIAFAGLWVFICWLVSLFSGWGRLADRYRCTALPTGTKWRFQSAGMRRWYLTANYGNCLSVTANDKGLGLAVLWPFRIGHPPLFIPWTDILVNEDRLFFFIKRVRITFAAEPSVVLWIFPRLAAKIQQALGQNWFGEPADAEPAAEL